MSEAVEAEALYGLVKVKLIYMERSHSLVECTGLENRRPARVRGFESHPLRQSRRSTILSVMCSVGKYHAKMEVICQSRKPGCLGSSPGASRI